MTRPYRLIIWGPGDMGGRALRTALESSDFEVVGVKVFSPHKHGKDIGELVGLAPVGITATTSKAEILALTADCVVHTPTTPSLVQGADADVLDLLESGKNVVSAASYHNPAMPTWLSESRSPLEVLRTVAQMRVTGGAFGPQLPKALSALKTLMRVADSGRSGSPVRSWSVWPRRWWNGLSHAGPQASDFRPPACGAGYRCTARGCTPDSWWSNCCYAWRGCSTRCAR
ncbi:hypothetical protein [Nocardia salmonicida]|uniref:hypothetical protein n=1 Tax=Nocardia salmonicida TaxID=53431 RepID=UPI0034200F02